MSAPDTFRFSIWDGNSWSAIQEILTTDHLSASAAYYDDNNAMLVYVRDLNGDPTDDADQELYTATWNGAVWTEAQLTNDALADNLPSVSYNSNGQIRLLWMQGRTLRYLGGTLSGPGAQCFLTARLPCSTTAPCSTQPATSRSYGQVRLQKV